MKGKGIHPNTENTLLPTWIPKIIINLGTNLYFFKLFYMTVKWSRNNQKIVAQSSHYTSQRNYLFP